LLDRAADAADTTSFRGTVVVRWSDGTRTYRQEVTAESANGLVRVGDTLRSQTGAAEQFDATSDWSITWGNAEAAAVPDPQRKYRLVVTGRESVAGRPAQVIEARTLDGQLRQRTYLDAETNLVLRRDVFDGTTSRSVEFASIAETSGATGFVHSPVLSGTPAGRVSDLPDGMVEPVAVASGYRLVGRYRGERGTYQLFYSDGLFTVSVFQQDGVLDTEAMPEGGRSVRVGGTRATQYTTPMGAVMVWERDGVVFTALGDAPASDVAAISASVVRDNRSTLERVVDWLLAPIRF